MNDADILYQDKTASGRSLENMATRMGGARNCLQITVFQDELWVTLCFPFAAFASIYDIEHRIKKDDIISIREQDSRLMGRSLVIDYRREDGRTAQFELVPKRYDAFKQALAISEGSGKWIH
jgi:hypothetical protein